MKLIIAGGRDLGVTTNFIDAVVDHDRDFFEAVTKTVSGECRGIDRSGEAWANYHKLPIKPFPYERGHGLAGGPIRNAKMAAYGDRLLLIWDGQSSGSASMKREMKKLNKPVFEVILRKS